MPDLLGNDVYVYMYPARGRDRLHMYIYVNRRLINVRKLILITLISHNWPIPRLLARALSCLQAALNKHEHEDDFTSIPVSRRHMCQQLRKLRR